MCFGAPCEYMHMDRHTDANDSIYAFLVWSYNPSYSKSGADLTRLYTVFQVKYGYLHVLSLPPMFSSFLHLGKDHSM